MRLYKIVLSIGLALAVVPAVAFAAKPAHPATPSSTNATTTTAGKSAAAKVQFVVHGSLSAYTAANGATNGTVSITVKSSNFDSKALKGTTLVLVVPSSIKVVLHGGKAIAGGDGGIVKFRAARSTSSWTGLTASQVIDQGPATTS